MTRLCIVRHGETAWNAEHRVQGQLDVPLNDYGRRQAQAVAAALGKERFSVIYSSDLGRARETAAPTAQALGMEVKIDPALRERHYGIFQTLTYADVKLKYPEDYARFERREPEYDFRTGESLRAFYERSVKCMTAIAAAHPEENVLVFTHGGVLDKLYRFVTGLSISAPREFRIPNCGINRLGCAGDPWQIHVWADVAHLDSALDDLKE
jgi:2,3-bisphosphoglycerate-dependent phosphoglycerate mutase